MPAEVEEGPALLEELEVQGEAEMVVFGMLVQMEQQTQVVVVVVGGSMLEEPEEREAPELSSSGIA